MPVHNKNDWTIEVLVFRPNRKPNVKERVAVYWPTDKQFYAGQVKAVDKDGSVTIQYDDGEAEALNLDEEVWEYAYDPFRYRTDPQEDVKKKDESKSIEHNPTQHKNDAASEEKDAEQNSTGGISPNPYSDYIPRQTEAAKHDTETVCERGDQKTPTVPSISTRIANGTVAVEHGTKLSPTRLQDQSSTAPSAVHYSLSQNLTGNATLVASRIEDEKPGSRVLVLNAGKRKFEHCRASEQPQVRSMRKRKKINQQKQTQKHKISTKRKMRNAVNVDRTDRIHRMPTRQLVQQIQQAQETRNHARPQHKQLAKATHEIQNTQSGQTVQNVCNLHPLHTNRNKRVRSPLLIRDLTPVKRYARIMRLREEGYKNEAAVLKMPF